MRYEPNIYIIFKMITSLNIKNFKAFKEADLSFANLTLLSGLNGMGKTTVIQSLLLLRQSYEKKTLHDKGLFLKGDYLTIGGGKDAYCRDGEEDYIEFELEWDDKFNALFNFCYFSIGIQSINAFINAVAPPPGSSDGRQTMTLSLDISQNFA